MPRRVWSKVECAVRMGPDCSWTTTQVRAVATPRDHARPPAASCAEVSSFPSCSSVCQICEGEGEPGRRSVCRTHPTSEVGERHSRSWGDAEGPAVDALKLQLDKARRAAKVPPLSVQITASQEFIKRSEKLLMDLEEERKAEAELLQDAKERLAQLEVANRAEATVSAPPAPPPTWAQGRPDCFLSKKSGMRQSGLPRASGKPPCAAHRQIFL